MPDNKDIRGGRDRQKINPGEPYEVRYAAEQLGVSQEEILQAINEVGNDRQKIEEYLRSKPNR